MVTVTSNGDVPQQPLNFDNSYLPDQLIAGVFPRVTFNGTVASGATVNTVTPLPRGTVMGQKTANTATAAAKAGNTGNGTASAVTVGNLASLAGVYTLIYTSATAFNVFNSLGQQIGQGVNGTSALVGTNGGIGITMTAGGTAFVAGDEFLITVVAGSGQWVPSVATATDGSEIPVAILADVCDPSGGAVNAGFYQTGEFNQNAITFDSGWTVAAITPFLRDVSIFLKTSVSASDPSNE